MSNYSTNEFKNGLKVMLDGTPCSIIDNEFVKPGKGQAFTRTKLKNLLTGRVTEKTFKSQEKLTLADVEETTMRMLYKEESSAVFMDDKTFDQITIPLSIIGEKEPYLMEDTLYDMVLYKGSVIDVSPPNFLNMKITETTPGMRGDTASGRVLKPAITETGAKVQVPIFIEEGQVVKIDTRTGDYVSRV